MIQTFNFRRHHHKVSVGGGGPGSPPPPARGQGAATPPAPRGPASHTPVHGTLRSSRSRGGDATGGSGVDPSGVETVSNGGGVTPGSTFDASEVDRFVYRMFMSTLDKVLTCVAETECDFLDWLNHLLISTQPTQIFYLSQ